MLYIFSHGDINSENKNTLNTLNQMFFCFFFVDNQISHWHYNQIKPRHFKVMPKDMAFFFFLVDNQISHWHYNQIKPRYFKVMPKDMAYCWLLIFSLKKKSILHAISLKEIPNQAENFFTSYLYRGRKHLHITWLHINICSWNGNT